MLIRQCPAGVRFAPFPAPRPVLLLILVLAAFWAPLAEARECAVSRTEGESLRIWSAGVWSPLTPGPLPEAAVKVETGPGSRAEITCDDGVTVTVGVETEVNLEVLVSEEPGPADAILQLIRGIVGLVAPDAGPRRFEVRTPLAIASVRSTEWLVEHDAEQGTAVFVREGKVVCGTRHRKVELTAGEGVTVPTDQQPQPVKVWGQARIDRSTGALGFAWP